MGWIAIVLWNKITKIDLRSLTKLFFILMSCGCDSATVLNEPNERGLTPLMFSSLSSTACKLLLTQTNIDFAYSHPFSDMPDIQADVLQYVLNGLWDGWAHEDRDACALQIIVRLSLPKLVSHPKRLVAYLWSAVCVSIPSTTSVLWTLIADTIQNGNRTTAKILISELQIPMSYRNNKFRTSILGVAALASDRIWLLLTTHLLTPLLLEGRPMRDFSLCPELSPLHVALTGISPMFTERAAWLAASLPASHLNQYNAMGQTPLMRCVRHQEKKTAQALLARISEIDLCAPRLMKSGPHDYNYLEELLLKRTTADVEWIHIQSEILLRLQSAKAELPRQKRCVSDTLFQNNFPKELRQLVLDYAYFGMHTKAASTATIMGNTDHFFNSKENEQSKASRSKKTTITNGDIVTIVLRFDYIIVP